MGRLTKLPPTLRWSLLGGISLGVLFVSWVAIQGISVKASLEKTKSTAQQAKDALLNGRPEEAIRFSEDAQHHARQARTTTHSVTWRIAATVPLVGSPLATTQTISDVILNLANDVLLPAVRQGATISPDNLINQDRVNLQTLRDQESQVSRLSVAANKVAAAAHAIPPPAYFSPIRDALSQLQEETSQLAHILDYSSIATKLSPPMLGLDGPRTYLVVFQNNAEARGTGGLIGGFGILVFKDGKPSVPGLAPNNRFGGVSADIDLGSEFNTNYGWTNPYTDARNSNLSSHFPNAAKIWKSMWDRISPVDQPIDGVISLDPVALSYILGAIGSVVTPDGEVVTQDNVVELMASKAYAKFPKEGDQDARKRYLQEIVEQVVKKATTGAMDSPHKLFDALGKAATERRIAVWSANLTEQELLERTPLAHTIPDDSSPFAEVIINNLAGNKLDYYLKRQIEYAADPCNGPMRNSTVTVRLENAAPEGLSDYVSGIEGIAPGFELSAPSGTMITSVRLLATKGAVLLSVTSNGERIMAIQQRERGHPSFEVQIAIPRGRSVELVFQLSEPTAPGEPVVPLQPLIESPAVKLSVPACTEPPR